MLPDGRVSLILYCEIQSVELHFPSVLLVFVTGFCFCIFYCSSQRFCFLDYINAAIISLQPISNRAGPDYCTTSFFKVHLHSSINPVCYYILVRLRGFSCMNQKYKPAVCGNPGIHLGNYSYLPFSFLCSTVSGTILLTLFLAAAQNPR